MQEKELNQSILELPEWPQFLRRSSVLIAAVLLGSALIMAIAANWLSWPKVGRIALILVTITALVLFALRTSLQKPKDWASGYGLSRLSIDLATIAIGGLLALIGQSYQTGADPWQLFALWSLLLLPWMMALRSLFIILLVLTITNVALILFFELGHKTPLFATLSLVGFNLFFLYGSHRVETIFHDPLLLVRRFSILFLVGSILWLQSIDWIVQKNAVHLQIVLSLAILGGLAWYFLRRQADVITGSIAYGGCYFLIMSWLMAYLTQSDAFILLMFLISIVLGLGLIFDLRRVWRQQSPANKTTSEPWFLRLIYLGIQLVITVFFLAVCWLFVGTIPEVMIHGYVLFSVVAIIIIQKKNNVMTQDLPVFLLLSSMALAAFGLDNLEANNPGLMAWFLLLNIVVYLFSPKVWLVRFCSAFIATGIVIIWWLGPQPLNMLSDSGTITYLQISLLTLVLTTAAIIQLKPTYKKLLRPVWLAWVCILLWLLGSPLFAFFFKESGQDFLVAVLISVLPPVVLMSLLKQRHSLQFRFFSALIVGLISVFALRNIPLANLALLGWIWAYAQRDRLLFWGSVLLLTAALGLHYYALQWSLILKAAALAAGGLGLGLSAILLDRLVINSNTVLMSQGQSSADFIAATALPRRIPIGLLLGLILVWVISVQDVWRKESLLANGVPLVLELAPVDPRSLMQGDYMALRFAIGQQINQIGNLNADLGLEQAASLRVYVTPSVNKKSTLVALQNPVNKTIYWLGDQHVDLNELAALKMQRKQGSWLPNGVDAWFFPEGQSDYFEQARYGAFKSNKKGGGLLFQLLDAKAQPLAAPAEIKN